MAKKKITEESLAAHPEWAEKGLTVGQYEPVEGEETVEVPLATLTAIQESLARVERELEEEKGNTAGLLEIAAEEKGAEASGEKKLRDKKSFEPKFRTVRLRKYPMAGGAPTIVVGWTNKGAYQEVDRSGVAPVMVDYLDIIFLGHERNEKGALKAEKVKLLDFLNAPQVHCKILDKKVEPRIEPTGEEIDITVFDPQHGLIATGDKVDGFTAYSDVQLTLQVPGIDKPVVVDGEFVN